MTTSVTTGRALGRRGLLALEVLLGVAVVVADVIVPTLVLLALLGLSLAVRHEHLRDVGLRRPERPWALVGAMAVFATAWTLVQLSLVLPVTEHLSGQEQDVSDFARLEGDLALLLALLALSWTLAAMGEELAYRGYLFTRITQVFGSGTTGLVVAVGTTSVVFGLAHREQGVVGVVVTAVDAVAFSLLRLRHGTLWAPILAHGLNNTIGFVAFYLVGPVRPFW